MQTLILRLVGVAALCTLAGCGGDAAPEPTTGNTNETAANADSADESGPRFTPLDVDTSGSSSSKPKLTGAARTAAIKKNLSPLLLVIGKWNGTIKNKAGVETVNWVYDVKTDETHPGLKMTTKTGGYLKEGRLTYLPDEEKYQFTAVENDGKELTFVGTFTEEPHDVVDSGDSKKVQRAFKLELKRDSQEPKHKLAKVIFNQKDNGRYLFELYDKRRRFDTINTMREGRSFGVSEDYGDKECIISQGLGTISLEHKGKTYWVCCSGCKAEFEADPEKWIAKYNAMKEMKK